MNDLQILAIKRVKELSEEINSILLSNNRDMGEYARVGSAFNDIGVRLRSISKWSDAIAKAN